MNLITHLSNRNFIMHVGWIEVGLTDEVTDLLKSGIVQCQNYNELLELLQRGWRNLSHDPDTHHMFTLTLEQQWVNPQDGRLQHRLSTISFCDLATSERVVVMNNLINREMVIHKNGGLQALDNVISFLSMAQQQQPMRRNSDPNAIPYNQTVLSTLLKDSFGGRAQTTVIVCVNSAEEHVEETLQDMQFALKAQCVRNFITMNAFVDNNTSIPGPNNNNTSPAIDGVPPDVVPIDVTATTGSSVADLIGGTSSSYLHKLVANAEQVFIKLMRSQGLSAEERAEVEEWLYTKAEFEDCISSTDLNNLNNSRSQQLHLGPIHETDEPSDDMLMYSENDNASELVGVGGTVSEKGNTTAHQMTTTTDSESEYQRADLDDKIENLMAELRVKTDALVEQRYNEYLRTHPRPIFESVENLRTQVQGGLMGPPQAPVSNPPAAVINVPEEKAVVAPMPRSSGGRRRSIQPGQTLSSLELEMLNRKHKETGAGGDVDEDSMALCLRKKATHAHALGAGGDDSTRSVTLKKWQKVATDMDATTRQIRELEHTISLKQKLVAELVKSNDTRETAKQRFHRKRGKLEAEYEKVKKQLTKAVSHGKSRSEVERLKVMTSELEKRLHDLASIKHIATDSGQNLKKLEQSLVDSRRECEVLQKTLKKERRLKEALEQELDKVAAAGGNPGDGKGEKDKTGQDKGTGKEAVTDSQQQKASNQNLKVVNDRLSHLDQVLREKSEHMERYQDGEQRESLRHEIRNLRRTRDHLLEQRCELARKLKREKVLTNTEERKLLECDEAIEAIDAAIEFKNELICGRKSVDTSVESLNRERGEQMLIARLNKLSEEEMRTLLYKYFLKVIDLRESGRKLEIQLLSIERERDTWEWRERMLSHAVRQARLEGERNAVLMQREHETKLTLMLRHLANETSSSGASLEQLTGGNGGHEVEVYKAPRATDRNYSGKLDVVSNRFKHQQQQSQSHHQVQQQQQHHQMEGRREGKTTNNKLFAKFQVLTQYSNEKRSVTGGGFGGGGGFIPTHNLRQLQPTTVPPVAKVTREKNKLIIQQCQERNHHEEHTDDDMSNGNALQYHPALHFRK